MYSKVCVYIMPIRKNISHDLKEVIIAAHEPWRVLYGHQQTIWISTFCRLDWWDKVELMLGAEGGDILSHRTWETPNHLNNDKLNFISEYF